MLCRKELKKGKIEKAITYFNRGIELSIDVLPQEHRQIKIYAVFNGQTISEYVLESIRKRLHHENEKRELSSLAMHLDEDPVLVELWDNEKDAAYDKL